MPAPQTKRPRKPTSVAAVQPISIAQLFPVGALREAALPRRYRMQNTQMRPKTSARIAAQSASSAMNSALTRSPLAALVSGQNGSQGVVPFMGRSAMLPAADPQEEPAGGEHAGDVEQDQ